MSRKHALLSASGASKWLNCTPSAKLESKIDEAVSSYADEGTLAHSLSENELRFYFGLISDVEYEKEKAELQENEYYNEEMTEYVRDYVDYCIRTYNSYGKNTDIGIEETVYLEPYIPEGFSHLDCRIIGNNKKNWVLEIIDLKYGKGIPVQAENNKQGLIYALGAYLSHYFLYDIQTVKITIFQPRIDNITVWELPAKELLYWAENELKTKASIAAKGEGEFKAGEWCRFCKVKPTCRAFNEMNLKIANLDFEDLQNLNGQSLDKVMTNNRQFLNEHEIAAIVQAAPVFKNWIEGILDYALVKALEGKQWPGLKLVRGRSIRRYSDTSQIIDTLGQYYDIDYFTINKLKSLTELEKLIGHEKLSELIGKYIDKPEGKPSLVLETDKRQAYDRNAEATNDFENF